MRTVKALRVGDSKTERRYNTKLWTGHYRIGDDWELVRNRNDDPIVYTAPEAAVEAARWVREHKMLQAETGR